MNTYAVSDLHGRLDLYREINKFLNKDDLVYFLGDANDRGPDGWELIKEIYRNPQWIYLKGNHEQMISDFLLDYLNFNYCDDDLQLLLNNGGYDTINKAISDNYAFEWARLIKNLPFSDTYESSQGKIFLSHSGAISDNEVICLWDRDHICEDWTNVNDIDFVIHGHTPIPYLKEFQTGFFSEEFSAGAYWYCWDRNIHEYRKCCIDNGSADSNCTCLLDLNSFDEHIFSI